MAIILPPGNALNTFANCKNIRVGPRPSGVLNIAGSPKAKTAGITISAATNAKALSQIAICADDEVILTSFFIYEP